MTTDRFFSKLSTIKDYLFGYLLIICNLSSMIVGFGVIGFEFCATAFPTKTEKITEFVKEKLGTSRRVLASIHPQATTQSKPRTRVAPVSNIVQEGPENPSEETRVAVGVLSVDDEEDSTEQTPTSLLPAMDSPTAGSVVPFPRNSSIPGPSGSGMIDPFNSPSFATSFLLSIHSFLAFASVEPLRKQERKGAQEGGKEGWKCGTGEWNRCARMTRKIGKEARKEGREYLADRHHSPLCLAVSHGDQAMQESSVVANGGLITTQAGESEDDDKLTNEEQLMLPLSDDEEGNCLIEITHSVASDEKQISFPARKGSAMLAPMKDSNVQNASSQSRPNMVGMVANMKVNAINGRPKARVQKMPSLDRNYESLSTEELEKFKRSSQKKL